MHHTGSPERPTYNSWSIVFQFSSKTWPCYRLHLSSTLPNGRNDTIRSRNLSIFHQSCSFVTFRISLAAPDASQARSCGARSMCRCHAARLCASMTSAERTGAYVDSTCQAKTPSITPYEEQTWQGKVCAFVLLEALRVAVLSENFPHTLKRALSDHLLQGKAVASLWISSMMMGIQNIGEGAAHIFKEAVDATRGCRQLLLGRGGSRRAAARHSLTGRQHGRPNATLQHLPQHKTRFPLQAGHMKLLRGNI